MSTLKQPEGLQELSVNTIVKLIPTYDSTHYLKLPPALLDDVQVVWLKTNLFFSKETFPLLSELHLCGNILNRAGYTNEIISYCTMTVEVGKLLQACYADMNLLKAAIRSTVVNTCEERRLQTIYHHTLRYHSCLMRVGSFVITEQGCHN